MERLNQISTSRIEAFSDGVIAIIITVMVFDLKFSGVLTEESVWSELEKLAPKFISYIFSFLMIAIMWVNHHQLFHQIKHTDRNLLWLSVHLLFWMSAIPFATNFIGANPMLWQASFFYGLVFLMSALSFALLRKYALTKNLFHESISRDAQLKIRIKNRLAMGVYFLAALSSLISVYISFGLFMVVPTMYFIPEKITHSTRS